MKVLLLENVKGIGRKGDVVEVKEGYFQNFLSPRKLAKFATDGAVKQAEVLKAKQIIDMEKNDEDASLIKSKLEMKVVKVAHKANGEKLYAKVGVAEIVEAIFKQERIRLKEKCFVGKIDIKNLGKFEVEVKLTPKVAFKIWIEVVAA